MSTYERPNVLLVTRALIKDDGDRFLLVKRPPDDRRNPNFWELPGGKVDIGETINLSLEREVREETGLVVNKISEALNSVDSYTFDSDNDQPQPLTYVAITTLVKTYPGPVFLSPEHTAYAWESLPKAYEYDLTDECQKALTLLGPLAVAAAQNENIIDTYRKLVFRLLELK